MRRGSCPAPPPPPTRRGGGGGPGAPGGSPGGGVRVPDAPVAIALVKALGRPLATTSASLPGEEPLIDAADIQEHLGHGLDLILDGGVTLNEPSTVLDLTGPSPVVLREGKGPVEGVVA